MWRGPPWAFFAGVALAGVGFGAAWPMLVVLSRHFFGARHFGANYMVFDGLGSAAGTLVFAKLLVMPFYNAHSAPADDDGDDDAAGGTTCHGARCFPYPVVAALNASAVAAALLLTYGPWARGARRRRRRPAGAA